MVNALLTSTEGAFTSFFPGLEVFPILKSEVIQITGLPLELLTKYEESGIISRSIVNEQRPSAKINNFSFYDIYRFNLIRHLHLSLFTKNAMIDDLVDEILDTLALEIDEIISYEKRRSIDQITASLAAYFKERNSEWRQFWLLNGDVFDSFLAARVCVNIWQATFDSSAQVILDFERRSRGFF